MRAPSTLGSFLRSFTWGNVLQLGKVNRLLLAGLARRAPLLPGKDAVAFVDVDSQQKRVYGHKKQGAAFGHAKIQGKSVLVRGLNALAATISTPLGAPVIAVTRLRGGSAGPARGTASLARQAVRTARDAGCTGTLVARADSAFYSAAFTGAVRAAGAFFSVTVQMNPHVAAAIAAIGEDAWTSIRYPRAIWDDQLGCWVSDAGVAETEYTAFTSKKEQAITARLIVRRVKDLNRKAGEGQDELFTCWRFTPSSPARRSSCSRPGSSTATTRWWNRCWRTGPTGPWLTCQNLRVVSRQRGLARPGGYQPQPAARRRVPGQPRLRQGPRRHAAPRPDRRRRPHRPPRPRRNHLAPARRLAPRAGMDEPVRGRLRPAADPGGLTSPHPVTAPPSGPPRPPAPHPRTRKITRKPPHEARPGRHTQAHPAKLRMHRSSREIIYRNSSVDPG